MKHLIIYNPKAGEDNKLGFDLKGEIAKNFEGLDYDTYETAGPRAVISFLKDYLKNQKDTVRVYACGGDGTIHEVANGLVGHENVELAILPIGTGNDFVKIYGASNKDVVYFRNFKSLIEGEPYYIDLSKITSDRLEEPWYSINVINFGFDAIVGAKGNENKLKGSKDPYGPGAIIPAILHGRFNKIIVKADGEQLNKKKLLLGSFGQGQYVGGKYRASPKSDNTDGLIDVVVMKPMSLMRLLIQYFGAYEKGEHLDNPKLLKRIYYKRAKNAEIIAEKEIDVCVDGEIIKGTRFNVDIMPKALKLIRPKVELPE